MMFNNILNKLFWKNPATQLKRRFIFNDRGEISPLYELSPLNAKYGLSQILSINRRGNKAGAMISCAGMSVRDEEIIKDFNFCFSMASEVLDFVILDLDSRKMDVFLQEEIINGVIESRGLMDNDLHLYVCLDRKLEGQEMDAMIDFMRMTAVDGIVCRDESQLRRVQEHCSGRMAVLYATSSNSTENALKMLSKGAIAILLEGRNNAYSVKRIVRQCQSALKNI